MAGIDRLLNPLRRGLAHIVARAVVTLVNDAAKMQTLQIGILKDEAMDDIEHWQGYGLTVVPHPGAEALVLAAGGHRAHSVVISCADRRYRLVGLEGGEVALYTDEEDKIHLKRGRVIEVETMTLIVKAGTGVHYDTPEITTTGRIVAQGDVIGSGVSLKTHPHNDTQPAVGQQSGRPIAEVG
ncbi:phage baseplate assembly protein V [Pseudomonas sp. F(2018)]|uniref:phage baseplate assembly protein V n=1 Tax=Pseudomonas sp. F(2018) TaxID=2502240 RepID=UPI0010FA0178|nr:phage baseplate assembly protein V [Pseudomonas sp. F(2018)]